MFVYLSKYFYVSTNTVKVIRSTVFTGQKTQPTISKYWRSMDYTINKKYNTQIQKKQANPLVYTNMGWLGDGSNRGQGRQAWTAVGLPTTPPICRQKVGLVSQVKERYKCKLHEICSIYFQEIIKIVATRWHILMTKCTKFYFDWGSAPDPTGELK